MTFINLLLFIALFNSIIGLFRKPSNVAYCGMVGFSGENTFDPHKIIMLMLANMSRGMHSTGIYNDGTIQKDVVPAIELLSGVDLVPETIFMGHDRFATIGGRTLVKNAHPFRYGSIVGQHNGTLNNHWELLRNAGHSIVDYDVDSQVLIKLISEQKDLKVLQEFKGAAALIWVDENIPDRIYCFRNTERPLFRGMIGKDMYISSIEESLYLIGCDRVKSFKENFVYAIEHGKIVLSECKRVIKKKVKNKKKTYNQSVSNYHSKNQSQSVAKFPVHNSERNQLDLTSNWVCKLKDKFSYHNVTQGVWYKVLQKNGAGRLLIINNLGTNVWVDPASFSSIEELIPGRHVKVMTHVEDNVFEKGEVAFLVGLEYNEEENITEASLEKLDHDNKTYVWNKRNIRKMSHLEIQKHLRESGNAFIEESEDNDVNAEQLNEQKMMHAFENDDSNKDTEGNRLGVHWIPVGSVYESFITARQKTDEVIKELNKVIEATEDAKAVKELAISRNKLSKVYDIAENEIESIFDHVYIGEEARIKKDSERNGTEESEK